MQQMVLLVCVLFPLATKNSNGQLRVGAAITPGKEALDRVAALVAEDVDLIVVDTAHGHSKGVIDTIKWIKKTYPEQSVMGGNIATADAAIALAKAGVDAVKVGMGPGSICTTRIVAGIGVPQISAIANVVAAIKNKNIPVIADGGIRFSGDVCKALAVGASCVMIGGLRSCMGYLGVATILEMQKNAKFTRITCAKHQRSTELLQG